MVPPGSGGPRGSAEGVCRGGLGGKGFPPEAGGSGGVVPPRIKGESVTGEQQSAAQPQRIDRYVGQYAARAVDMVASEIRALFAVAARPEIVSLAGGLPYVAALPLDVVGEMIGQLIANHGTTANRARIS